MWPRCHKVTNKQPQYIAIVVANLVNKKSARYRPWQSVTQYRESTALHTYTYTEILLHKACSSIYICASQHNIYGITRHQKVSYWLYKLGAKSRPPSQWKVRFRVWETCDPSGRSQPWLVTTKYVTRSDKNIFVGAKVNTGGVGLGGHRLRVTGVTCHSLTCHMFLLNMSNNFSDMSYIYVAL